MPTPGEHKTVQARILAYAEASGAVLGQFGQLHTDIYDNLFHPFLSNGLEIAHIVIYDD